MTGIALAKHSVNNNQTPREERLNTLSHTIAAILSAVGLAMLAFRASANNDPWVLVGSLVFGTALVLLYTTSAIYHSLPVGPRKERFRSFDHMGIYLLIAGTYTVVSLTVLRESVGWGLFGAQWGMAAGGIALKSIYGPERYNFISTLGYVVMGWMIVAVFGSLLEHMPSGALVLLLGGGVFYTLGVPFFLLDQSRRYFHTVWHGFVMAGSLCHFLMAWLYLS
jgi:hemolysin III